MKKLFVLVMMLCVIFALAACSSGNNTENTAETEADKTAAEAAPTLAGEETENTNSKILVAYFSCTGNTAAVAEKIADKTGGVLYEITPLKPYTEDDLNYNIDGCRANTEQNDPTARPEISGTVENMEDYDTVYVGYPIWWGEAPKIMYTFMESYDFSGKTIIPFCTSGSSPIGDSAENMRSCAPDAIWLTGARFSSSPSESDIADLING